MVKFEKMYCTKRLFDRDFLYGIFPKAGFVEDPEEFLQTPGENPHCECNPDDDTCRGAEEEPGK